MLPVNGCARLSWLLPDSVDCRLASRLASFEPAHPQAPPPFAQGGAWGCHTRRSLLRGSDAVPASAKHSQTMSKNWYAETCIPYGLCNHHNADTIYIHPVDWN